MIHNNSLKFCYVQLSKENSSRCRIHKSKHYCLKTLNVNLFRAVIKKVTCRIKS